MDTEVLLVDDHDIVRFGLASLLQQDSEYIVVGQARNGLEALEMVKKHTPDLVVMDLSMPGMNGLDATRAIHTYAPHAKIIIQSSRRNCKWVWDCLKAGATGYVLKKALVNELLPAAKTALRGGVYLCQELADQVGFDSTVACPSSFQAMPELSPRERQVLQLLAEGKRSEDIGKSLQLCKNTIVSHRQNIMNKLQLRSVAQLTKYAIQEGITSLDF